MFLYSEHSDASSREAVALLDRAVQVEPGYARAHGLHAVCLVWRAFQGWEDRETTYAQAADAADRAVAIDPAEPWAHLAHGFTAIARLRHAEAAAAIGRAIECIDRCVRLSPRDIFGHEHQLYYAFAHFQAGRYAEAAATAQLPIRQRPGHPVPLILAAASLGLAGEAPEACWMFARLTDLVPDLSAAHIEETFLYARREDRARAAAGLRAAGLVR